MADANNIRHYKYNAKNELILDSFFAEVSPGTIYWSTPDNDFVYTRTYDSKGKVLSLKKTHSYAGSTTTTDIITDYTYDTNDRVVKEKSAMAPRVTLMNLPITTTEIF